MFTIKNSKGEYLRYLNPFIFGFNPKKPLSFYKVGKMKTAQGLLEQIKATGVNDVFIHEFEFDKTKAPKKEKIAAAIDKNMEILGGGYVELNSEELFNEIHKKCLSCVKTCKQSARVTIINC